MDNAGIVGALREIAALLALKGESRFKVQVYERGARAIEALAEDAGELARGRLRAVPGIGPTLARTLVELSETGRNSLLAELREGAPPGAAELASVLTRRQMATLHEALAISSLADLRAACEAGRVRQVPGFGERSERRLLAVIEALSTERERVRLPEAADLGERLLAYLRHHPAVERIDLAGDLRRRVELVDQLVIVVATRHPEPVIDHIARAPMVGAVHARTHDEVRLRLVTGLDVEILLVPEEAYVVTLHRATGSEAHIAKLAAAAQARGVSIEAGGLPVGRAPFPSAGRPSCIVTSACPRSHPSSGTMPARSRPRSSATCRST
jgi:DNA polymerase (family 10)